MGLAGPFGFSNGLNAKTTVFNGAENQLTAIENFRYYGGSLYERLCAVNWNSTIINGVGNQFVQMVAPNNISVNSANSNPAIVVVDGKIYKITPSGVATDISGATTFGSGSQQSYSNADILNGRIVIGDPSGSGGAMATWNDTGNATMLTSPQCNVVRSVNNFMFAMDCAATANSRVYWSNVADPTSWNGSNNYIDFRPGDGDQVVDIHYIGTDLYIFKRRSIGRLSTLTVEISGAVSLGPLTTSYVGIGAAGPGCVDKLPDGRLIFSGSDNHAYILDGSSVTDISDQQDFLSNVQPLADAFAPATGANSARVCVYPPRNEAWFIYTNSPISSGNPWDRALIYNYKQNIWSYFTFGVGTVTTGNERCEYIKYIPNIGFSSTFGALGKFGLIGNLFGGYGGYLMVHDPATAGGSLGANMSWSVSLRLSGEARTFIPRSAIIPFKCASTPGSASFVVQVAFDGGSYSTAKTITPTTSYQRAQIPISVPSSGFQTIQIKIVSGSAAGAGTLFEPFFLSDEVVI